MSECPWRSWAYAACIHTRVHVCVWKSWEGGRSCWGRPWGQVVNKAYVRAPWDVWPRLESAGVQALVNTRDTRQWFASRSARARHRVHRPRHQTSDAVQTKSLQLVLTIFCRLVSPTGHKRYLYLSGYHTTHHFYSSGYHINIWNLSTCWCIQKLVSMYLAVRMSVFCSYTLTLIYLSVYLSASLLTFIYPL